MVVFSFTATPKNTAKQKLSRAGVHKCNFTFIGFVFNDNRKTTPWSLFCNPSENVEVWKSISFLLISRSL